MGRYKLLTNFEKFFIGLLLIAVIVSYGCDARNSSSVPKSNAGGVKNSSGTNSAKLVWDVPQKKINGDPLNNIKGFKIYYGTVSGMYSQAVTIPLTEPSLSCNNQDREGKKKPDKRQCDYLLQGLGKGVYYFAVTTYDASGNESDFSNEISKQLK